METKPSEMTTLTAVLEALRQQHHDNEFTIKGDGFTTTNGKIYKPEELTIIRTYRFEGASNPSDEEVVYAIESKDGLKGVLVDAFGMYSESLSEAMVEKLHRSKYLLKKIQPRFSL